VLTETYKGRKLKVARGREWGTLTGSVNGTPVSWPISRDEAAVLADLRNQVDWIDREPVDGARWGAEWYAPGAYAICERSGIHPVALGGQCRHPYCIKAAREEAGSQAAGPAQPGRTP